MAAFTEANLGSIAKQLGGLATQYHIFPFVYVGATGYNSPHTLSRSGAELTGYSTNTNSSGSGRTIDKVTASVFDSSYLPIISEESLSESWPNGDDAVSKFIITFTR
jgi:hypothetical protein